MDLKQRELFGHRLRNLRIASGESQRETARKLYISRACLSNYEQGKRFPATEVLCELAKYFKVDVSYLIANDDGVFLSGIEDCKITIYEHLIEDRYLDLSGLSSVRKMELIDYLLYLKQKNDMKIRVSK